MRTIKYIIPYCFFMVHVSALPCSAADIARFPSVAPAIDAWSTKHGFTLLKSTKELVADQFCEAAMKALNEHKASDVEINNASGEVLFDFLDRENNDESTMRSMTASLNSALGAAGLSRPVMRRLARIKIEYAKVRPTLMRIGNEVLPAQDFYLIVPGPSVIKIAGILNDTTVCNGMGQPVTGQLVSIRCE